MTFRPRPTIRAMLTMLLVSLPGAARLSAQDEVVRTVREHDIGFLVDDIPQFPVAQWPSSGGFLLAAGDEFLSEAMTAGFGAFGAGFEEHAVTPGTGLPPISIRDLIRHTIDEDSWSNSRNRITIRDTSLVVVQTPEVQQRIEEFLALLRARRARMVLVDVALVPAEALGDADLGAESLPAETLDAVLRRAGEAGERLSLTAYNDQTVSSFNGTRRSMLVDEEVNQTGVIPVVNSVVRRIPLGLTVQVTPRVIEGIDRIELDLRLTRLALDGEVETRETFFSEIEIAPLREKSLFTRLVVEPGRVVIAGSFRESRDATSDREFAVLVRARPRDIEAERDPAPPTGRHELRALDIRSLLPRREEDPSSGLRPEVVGELVLRNVDPEAWRDDRAAVSTVGSGVLLVSALPETHRRVASWLAGELRRSARQAVVEITGYTGPIDAVLATASAATEDGVLPEDWRGGAGAPFREAFRGASRGLLGETVRARGSGARSFVADLECISGGTGFSIVELPDAVMDSAGDGFQLETVVTGGVDPDRVLLRVALDRARSTFGRTARFTAPAEIARTASGRIRAPEEATDPKRAEVAWLTYDIDLVDQDREQTRAEQSVPLDRDFVIEARRSGSGAGRLVVARVRLIEPSPRADEAPEPAPDGAARRMRVYPLHLTALDPSPSGALPSPLGVRSSAPAGMEWDVFEAGEQSRSLSESEIPTLIEEMIAPDTWSNSRNSIEIEPPGIAVVQRPEVLEQIDELLSRLEAHVSRAVLLEVAIVPPAAIAEIDAGWRRADAPAWLDDEALGRAVRAAGSRGMYLARGALVGAPYRLLPETLSSRLTDHGVSGTGVIPVVNPWRAVLQHGIFAEAMALLDDDAGICRLDVTIGLDDLQGDLVERRTLPRGEVELLHRRQARVETTVVGPVGRTLVLGAVDLPVGPDERRERPQRFVAFARIRPLFSSDAGDAARRPAILDCGLLTAPHRASGRFRSGEEDDDAIDFVGDPESLAAPIDEGLLFDLLSAVARDDRSARVEISESQRTVLVRGRDETISGARDVLAELVRRRARPVVIDVWQGSVDTDALRTLDSTATILDDTWLDRFGETSGQRARLVGLSGVVLSLGSVASRGIVAGVERLSGGTGQVLVEVTDPEIRMVGEGLSLTAHATLVPGTSWAQLRIQGELGRPPTFGRRKRIREDRSVEPREGAPADVRPTGEWIEIDLPEEHIESWQHLVTAPLGRPVLLNALPDPTRPGTTLVLIATVHAPDLP